MCSHVLAHVTVSELQNVKLEETLLESSSLVPCFIGIAIDPARYSDLPKATLNKKS